MKTTLEVFACCIIGAGIIPFVVHLKQWLHAFYNYFN